MNKEIVSRDGLFKVYPSEHSISKEEIPKLIMDASKILLETVLLYRAIVSGDTLSAGKSIVDIYNTLLDIKKMVED